MAATDINSYDPYQKGELDKALFAMQVGLGKAADLQSAASKAVGDYATKIAALNIDYLKSNALQANAILTPYNSVGFMGGTQLLNMTGANGPQAQQQTLSFLSSNIQQNLGPLQTQALQTGNTSALSAINSVYGGAIFSSDPNVLRQQAQQAYQASTQQIQQYQQQVQQGVIKPVPLSSFNNPYAKELESVKNLSTSWNSGATIQEKVQFDQQQQAKAQTEYDTYMAGVKNGTIKDDQAVTQQKAQSLFADIRKFDSQIKTGQQAIQNQLRADSYRQAGNNQAAAAEQAYADQAVQNYNKNNVYDQAVKQTQGLFDGASNNFQSQQNQQYQAQQSALSQAMARQQAEAKSTYTQQMEQANALQQQQQNTPTALDGARTAFGNTLNKQQMAADPNFAANTINSMVDPANNVVNNYLNNSFLNPAINAMTTQGTNAIMSNAGAKGMLGSGQVLQDIYNNGQSIAGQYIIPGIQQLSSQVLQSGTTSANNELNNRTSYNTSLNNLQGQMSSDMLNTAAGLSADTSYKYANMLSGQTTGAFNAQASNNSSALSNLFNTGAGAGSTQSQQQYGVGSQAATQNQWAAEVVNTGTLASASAQANAELQKRQLQYMGTQYGLNTPKNNGFELGTLAGGNMAMMGLAMLGGI